jgi:hypothetical protein
MSPVWRWDKNAIKYEALTRVRSPRPEIIEGPRDMMRYVIINLFYLVDLTCSPYALDSNAG